MSLAKNVDFSQLSTAKLREMVEIQEELEQREALEKCKKSPLYWARNLTRTTDPHYLENGTEFKKQFPNLRYFDILIEEMLREERLFIPKSRELMTSWLVMAFSTWAAQFQPGSFTVIQTEKEDKVKNLIEYCQTLYDEQPPWLQKCFPLTVQNTTELRWKNGSRILGVPAGADQIRMHHPNRFVLDEAAFLPAFQESYDTANPVVKQIIAVSSAAPGPFADLCEKHGKVETLHTGMEAWHTANGIRVVRLHYEADPAKGGGEKVFVPEVNMWLSPWAAKQCRRMTDPARYKQEFEVEPHATSGQLVFQLNDAATIVDPRPIPADWTRYFALDPHPQVPHACLWCAVDPYGNRWYYRELWWSKVCGKPGRAPEDDNRHNVKDMVETIKWLESKDNPENNGKDERIYKRVIDYAARAQGQGTCDDPDMPNMQQRYESRGDELGVDMRFEDAKKDLDVGIEAVNEGLRPIPELDPHTDTLVNRSKIRIFSTCVELIWELRNNRWKQLSATQALTHDPPGKVIEVRKHMTDNLRYIELSGPEYIRPIGRIESSWSPLYKGINY